mmetsp:Transcript_15930/g.38042  ORF Transcript_15930/g.38042 Transcript_15930/m.38042 type:complete len:270 (+) Transcript_15930:724-1533(+)
MLLCGARYDGRISCYAARGTDAEYGGTAVLSERGGVCGLRRSSGCSHSVTSPPCAPTTRSTRVTGRVTTHVTSRVTRVTSRTRTTARSTAPSTAPSTAASPPPPRVTCARPPRAPPTPLLLQPPSLQLLPPQDAARACGCRCAWGRRTCRRTLCEASLSRGCAVSLAGRPPSSLTRPPPSSSARTSQALCLLTSARGLSASAPRRSTRQPCSPFITGSRRSRWAISRRKEMRTLSGGLLFALLRCTLARAIMMTQTHRQLWSQFALLPQ